MNSNDEEMVAPLTEEEADVDAVAVDDDKHMKILSLLGMDVQDMKP
jgi:hypothetical protein